ncbi:MAG: hypothetical protein EP301_02830 [Gammaproteobacteria bacterium]|nr:MAG: hypothetical protein EP301_02830 [Gammaproteobacteria bacterium]
MKRFRNILVVVPQGVDAAGTVQAAARLAADNDARLTLFDAVPRVGARRLRKASYVAADLQRIVEQGRAAELADLGSGIDAEVVVTTGTPFLEVIRRAVAYEHDLVMTPPDQPPGSRGLSRASMTMHLLRKCPVPVWVYRSASDGAGDVLAAVGPFDEGVPSQLDRKIVELGSSLAARQGGRFHLVHAWSLQGESLLRGGRFGLPAGEVDRLVEEAMLDAETGVDKLLADTGVMEQDVAIHLTKGDAAVAIGETAARLSPAVVVMGTLVRSGIAGLLIGNTAEIALGSLNASVLAVKPNGFATPVSLE